MSDEFDRLIYEAMLEHQYNDMKEIIDALLARAEKAEADNVKLRDMVAKLIEAAEPFLTFRKIVTEKPGSDWDKELYKHHLDTWNRLIAELNTSQNKPEV